MGNRHCVFCKIVNEEEAATVHHRDDELIVFDDKYPDAELHLLVCPLECIRNIKALKPEHLPLVRRMRELGIKMLEQRKLPLQDATLGFHVPPVNSVNHLHMHVLAPRSRMKAFTRFLFDERQLHFKSVDALINELAERADKHSQSQPSAPQSGSSASASARAQPDPPVANGS